MFRRITHLLFVEAILCSYQTHTHAPPQKNKQTNKQTKKGFNLCSEKFAEYPFRKKLSWYPLRDRFLSGMLNELRPFVQTKSLVRVKRIYEKYEV